jgi:Uma2 family endonuclease
VRADESWRYLQWFLAQEHEPGGMRNEIHGARGRQTSADARPAAPCLLLNEPFFSLAPDWLCEVLSPSTERIDRADKLPIYASEGVNHVWLVNPLLHTLEVLRLESQKWLTLAAYRDSTLIRAEPFEAIEFDLGVLWADVKLE